MESSLGVFEYRRMRMRIRWAIVINIFSGVVNGFLGYVLYQQTTYELPGTPGYIADQVGGIITMIGGALLLVIAVLLIRRIRFAAGVGIALGIINLVFLLWFVLQGGIFTLIIGTSLYLWLNIRAYSAIPEVATEEQRDRAVRLEGHP
jgi:hypothetical protein